MILRKYQEKMVADIRAAMRAGHKRILCVAPTGSGKTTVFSYIAKALSQGRKPGTDEPRRCLVVAHRRELVKQAWRRMFDAGVEAGLIVAGSSIQRSLTCQIASVQTLANRPAELAQADVIIVDEAHHVKRGNQWGGVVEANPDAVVLGFTATPCRLDGSGLGDPQHGGHGFFTKIIEGPRISRLIADGYLAPFDYYWPRIETPSMADVGMLAGDYDTHDLFEIFGSSKVVSGTVAKYKEMVDGKPAIVFVESVETAERTAAEFRRAGYSAAAVSAKTDVAERDAIIDGLGNGNTDQLISCDIVNEGLDVPAAVVAIFRRPTWSLGLFMQQAGRVLRPKRDGGRAVFLDLCGNIIRHGFPDEDREWTLESKRRNASKLRSAAERLRLCRRCSLASPITAAKCRGCGVPFPTRERELEEFAGHLTPADRKEIEEARKRLAAGERRLIRSHSDAVLFARKHEYDNPEGWAAHYMDSPAMQNKMKKIGAIK